MSTENRLIAKLETLCDDWESPKWWRSECREGIIEAASQLREVIEEHMLSKRPKDLKAGTYQQPGATDDTTGKVWPGVHGETENPPLQPETPVAGSQLGSGSHGFRVHKK